MQPRTMSCREIALSCNEFNCHQCDLPDSDQHDRTTFYPSNQDSCSRSTTVRQQVDLAMLVNAEFSRVRASA